MTDAPKLVAALSYAARGWPVVPLHAPTASGCSCRKADCDKVGKHPRTQHGLSEASTEEKVIRGWWAKWPDANVGCVAGPTSGVWVLGPDGQEGIDDLAQLEAENGPLPPTAHTQTGSGGQHLIFRWPTDGLAIPNRRNHRGTKIDIRACGDGPGYFVAPPSRNGVGPYSWGADVAPAEAPAWLLEWVRGSAFTVKAEKARPDVTERAKAYVANCPGAVSREGGHSQTFKVARALCWGFCLDEDAALDILQVHYNPKCKPEWSEKELRHKVTQASTKDYGKPRGYLLGDRAIAAEASATKAEPGREWPDPPHEAAYHGLIGEFVRIIEPTTEADSVAILGQALVYFGNVVGRSAHFLVEADKHHTNEFLVLVGQSSKARKGTSRGQVHRIFTAAEKLADGLDESSLVLGDTSWSGSRNQSGLSSGEGLIWAVRDPIEKTERVKEKGQEARYEKVIADEGESDKRLLVYEPEFANVLKQTERQGNTLSTVLRQSWESGSLRSMTKNSPARATGAHVSIIGHITSDELRRYLTATESANGFGNRHMWIAVRRSKELPEGGSPDREALDGIQARLAEAIKFARGVGEVRRDDEARELWRSIYSQLSADRPGLSGCLLGRAEAHVMRLALIYTLLDRSDVIRAEHLVAATAFWDYAERSVLYVFGDSLGDPLADDLFRLLRQTPAGITRTDINTYLGRNVPAAQIGRALGLLLQHGRARVEHTETGGRPSERWFTARK